MYFSYLANYERLQVHMNNICLDKLNSSRHVVLLIEEAKATGEAQGLLR